MKRLVLAASLIAALPLISWAQDTKPAVAAKEELSAKEKATVGTYKSAMPGSPTITLKASGKQLILAATGYPELPVSLDDKDRLIAQGLPEGFSFSVVRDKDGKITGLKISTPQGAGEFTRIPDAAPAPKKPSVPDILGKYESDEVGGQKMISEVTYEKGKLIVRSPGQADFSFTLNPDDTLKTEPALPDGAKIKMTRDKDGKIIGSTVESSAGKLNFTRKTFPKPPSDEAPAVASIPDVLGKYEPETPGPVGDINIILRDGKLVSVIEGQPETTFTLDKDDNIVSKDLPAGVTARFVKDKDGKVIKLVAKANEGEMAFVRKTFVKPPAPAAPKADPLEALKQVEGTYTSETPGVPVVTMQIKDGKLMVEATGNPAVEVTLTEKDTLKGDKLPEGFVLTLVRDKDRKVTGMKVETPMGAIEFTRKPLGK